LVALAALLGATDWGGFRPNLVQGLTEIVINSNICAKPPEEVELIDGKLFWGEEERLTMFAHLPENEGVNQAVRIGNPGVWRAAVANLPAS
jgi:hypothetical protein